MGPPNPQTGIDRDYLRSLFPLFKNFPENFEFPLVADPHYQPTSNSLYVIISASIVCSITTAIACARFWIRSRGTFGMDDWVMVAAFVSYCVFNCVNVVGLIITGLGYHLYDLSVKDIHSSLVIQYLHTVLWTMALHLTRCSILHLLLRLVPAQSRVQRRFLQTVLFMSYIFLVCNLCILIFECSPVQAAFDLRARLDGNCIGSDSIGIYGGLCAGHILLDLLTIVPPIFVIARLPMSKGKKTNLYILLGLGVVTIIFTSVRMFYFYQKMVDSFDLTRNATSIGFWSIMESSLAVVIACLPAINHSIRRFFRRLYGSDCPRGVNNKHGTIQLDANKIYKGHAKYVSYSADATALTTRSFVELSHVRSNSEEHLTDAHYDLKATASYPDITVERSFHISEERASVLESKEAEQKKSTISRPNKACIFSNYRWGSPSTQADAEESTTRT